MFFVVWAYHADRHSGVIISNKETKPCYPRTFLDGTSSFRVLFYCLALVSRQIRIDTRNLPLRASTLSHCGHGGKKEKKKKQFHDSPFTGAPHWNWCLRYSLVSVGYTYN